MKPGKYKPYPTLSISNRTWPDQHITQAPIWCSVDLRDGNQALINPLSIDDKLDFFKLLVHIGFKDIEVGFPSASQIEFDFIRRLIDEQLIPDDVSIQVLVQAREMLIRRTVESLQGAHQSIVHLYNSTSVNQRKIVFKKDMESIIELAVQGVRHVKHYAEKFQVPVRLQYSPESFTGTEFDKALAICNAVIHEWNPRTNGPIIINLPATVELATPNVYADMIEWMHRHLVDRDQVILSIHTHNDRGCAVAAAELGLMAGATRVEGTLFGNGERTGNTDIVTMALNMETQGVSSNLDFSRIITIRNQVEEWNQIPVHVRHPYAGDLVFTAFSGSHQDAINKGFAYQDAKDDPYWEVPYLPIDPEDIGRSYEGIIRINSQSGKGGIAYILKAEGFEIPKHIQSEVSKCIQQTADETGQEVAADDIYRLFKETFINVSVPITEESVAFVHHTKDKVECRVSVHGGIFQGIGNGPIDACRHALSGRGPVPEFNIVLYEEHALHTGSDAQAVSYVQIRDDSGNTYSGAGVHSDIARSAVLALVGAVNRMITSQ